MVMHQSVFRVQPSTGWDFLEPPSVYMIWEGDDGVRFANGNKGERLVIAVLGVAQEWLPAWWAAV